MELTLTASNFDAATMNDTSPLLVDFWASWCGPCRAMAPVIEEIASEATGFRVGKVNVDEEPDVAQRFNILSIPTFLIFKSGRVVDQFSGVTSKAAVLERLQKVL